MKSIKVDEQSIDEILGKMDIKIKNNLPLLKIKKLIVITVLLLFFSCENEKKLEGYYYICSNDEDVYSEVYFKKDSIRVAKDNEWVGFTKWRAYKIEDDSLRFITFGEWQDSTALKISYLDNQCVLLKSKYDWSDNTVLNPIDMEINFNDTTEFWSGFNLRKNEYRCY